MMQEEKNIELVRKVYSHVLQREPDNAGLQFWLKKIELDHLDYSDLVKLFMDSDEYKMKDENEKINRIKFLFKNGGINLKDISASRLDEICNPTNYNDLRGITSKFYHKFSIHITKFFLMYKIPAHFATICGILFAVIGSLFLTTLSIPWMILGIIFIEFHFMFDLSDGEIARFYQKDSAQGTYFDILSHIITSPIIWISLIISHYLLDQNILVFATGAMLIVASIVIFGSSILRRMIISVAIFSRDEKYSRKSDPKNIFIYENLKLEKLRAFVFKYFVITLPGNTHIASLYALGLIVGIIFNPFLNILLPIIFLYAIIWNFAWIIETYLILRKKEFDRFLNRIK